MSTFNGIYIRANAKATLAAVRYLCGARIALGHQDHSANQRHGRGPLRPDADGGVRQGCEQFPVEQYRDFIGINLPPQRAPETTLACLSELFETDVFWLGFQSAMDCFEFQHWNSGRNIRSLAYGQEEERTWERADGTPESWEAFFFFHPKLLEDQLKWAENDEEKEVLRRVYREGKIVVGSIYPSLGSKETSAGLAEHYGFPHYGLK